MHVVKSLCSFSIALGFLGWMSYVTLVVIRDHTRISQYCAAPLEEGDDVPFWSSDKAVRIIFSVSASLIVFLLHGI